ncbi:MFS transporter [Streptomyces bauhiniae]|uniref:MFS transporter n=1 Tax=Streptomyces bauhiniae TaxID=2340725 RepID=A0A7K3QRF8_9ACTN|nr:MFS transporter [Streptomyces bauhiniae]NEB92370.1 MFS transporter [Streptomyces bauhiniae]
MTATTPPPPTAPAAAAAAPAWRDVYVLAGMRGLSFAGDIAAATALTLLLQAGGAGSYAVMALLLAAAVPPALLAPVTGRFADRFDSRRLIVTVASLQILACLAMTQTTTPALLIVLAVLLSSGLAFTHPVFAGLPAAMVGKDNVPRASAISQTTAMAGMVIAPGIAGFLTAHFGVRISLLLDAASFAVVVAGALTIRTRLHHTAPAAQSTNTTGQQTAEPAYRVSGDRFLRSILAVSGVVMAAASIINVLIVFYVRDTFGGSEETYGLIMSAWMAGLVPGALLVRRIKKLSHEALLIGSFLCISVGILATGLAPGAWWIVPCYVIGGFGNGAQATVTHIVINLRVPDSHRGRAFAALGAVSNTGPALGYLMGGVILGFIQPRYAFLLAGTCSLLAVLVFHRALLHTADTPAADNTRPDTTGTGTAGTAPAPATDTAASTARAETGPTTPAAASTRPETAGTAPQFAAASTGPETAGAASELTASTVRAHTTGTVPAPAADTTRAHTTGTAPAPAAGTLTDPPLDTVAEPAVPVRPVPDKAASR